MPTPSLAGRRSSSIRDASLALARVASRRFVAPHEAFGGRGGSSKDGGSSKESSADGSKYGGNDPVLRQLLRRDNEAPRARVVQRVVTLDRVVFTLLGATSFFYVIVVPLQACFRALGAAFELYAVGYAVDVVCLGCTVRAFSAVAPGTVPQRPAATTTGRCAAPSNCTDAAPISAPATTPSRPATTRRCDTTTPTVRHPHAQVIRCVVKWRAIKEARLPPGVREVRELRSAENSMHHGGTLGGFFTASPGSSKHGGVSRGSPKADRRKLSTGQAQSPLAVTSSRTDGGGGVSRRATPPPSPPPSPPAAPGGKVSVPLSQLAGLQSEGDEEARAALSPTTLTSASSSYTTTSTSQASLCSWETLRPMAWPLLEFVCSLPYDALFWSAHAYLVPWVRCTRLLQGFRLPAYLGHLQRSPLIGYTKAKFLHVFLIMFVATHLLACVFHLAAAESDGHYQHAPWWRLDANGADVDELPSEEDRPSVGTLYLRALYWSFMTMSTVGHVDQIGGGGDSGAGPTAEKVHEWEVGFGLVVIALSTVMYTFVVAHATTIILRADTRVQEYRNRLEKVDLYLSKCRVSHDLRTLVRQHFRSAFEDRTVDDDVILAQMPRTLRIEVMRDMNFRCIGRCWVFSRCDPLTVKTICSILRRTTFLPGETICKEGEVSGPRRPRLPPSPSQSPLPTSCAPSGGPRDVLPRQGIRTAGSS